MTYGYEMDVPAPIEFYDALHAAIGRHSNGRADGLLLHLGRATATGFQVIEINIHQDLHKVATHSDEIKEFFAQKIAIKKKRYKLK